MPNRTWSFSGGDPIGDLNINTAAIRDAARAFQAWSARLNDGGNAFKKVTSTDAWEGDAAEAFKAKVEVEPKRWFESSDGVLEAARALDTYAYTGEWANREIDEARAEWWKGYESSRDGASLNANPAAVTMWQQQMQLEKLFGAKPTPAYPGDIGAGMRAHALWRANNARAQLDDVGNEAAGIIEAAADNHPINRNVLENIGEFFGGGWDNIVSLFQAVTDPGGTVTAGVDQAKLWTTDQQAAFNNLVDKEGYDKSQARWWGSMLLSLGVGKAGKFLRAGYLPPHLKPGYFDKYRASGHAPLPGRNGGDAVIKVRGEDLDITPEIREQASYLNPYRMDHIIERHGPDTPYPDPNTTQFPKDWSHDKIFDAIQDVASNPSSEWIRRSGDPGTLIDTTSDYVREVLKEDMAPARFTVNGFYEGVPIRVAVEPYGEGIISGFIPN